MQCAIRSVQPLGQQNLHCLRLYFVLSGSIGIRIGSRSYHYTADEIALINAHEPFSITKSDAIAAVYDLDVAAMESELPNLWFSREPIPETNIDPVFTLKSLLARYGKFNMGNDLDNTYLNRSMYYAIVHHLVTFFRINRPSRQALADSKALQMENVVRYIDQNYKDPLSLSDLAGRFYLSPSYLSRLFRQFYSTTFSDYLMNIRLQACLPDLSAKSPSIEALSEQYGFPNSRSFIAHFKKKYGITPGQYRKQRLEQLDTADQTAVYYSDISRLQELGVFAKYLTGDVDPGHATSDALIKLTEVPPVSVMQSGTPLTHNFRRLTSTLCAKDILTADHQEMLRTLQREVGFELIRFHGIFDDALAVYGENERGEPELSFGLVDMILDFLLSIGLRPFIELSHMPKKLTRPNAREADHFHAAVGLPVDDAKWNDLVAGFVRHLNRRYGSKEVASWPFSLGNLPDSGSAPPGTGSTEDYFHFYRNTYRVVKEQNAGILFGGPSILTETAEQGAFLPDFLQLCRKHQCMPDFLQYHFYPIRFEAQSRRLTYLSSPNALKESIETVYHSIQHCPGSHLPLYITEWSSTISHRELLSDTAFQAAYIVKNVLENYDSTASLCYYSLADTISDEKADTVSAGKMSADLFHGGLGLFTYNGIKKASYHAFRLLAGLGNERLASGDGYFITRSDTGWQIILYNYQHYSELYARGELFDMTFTNRYTPFPNTIRQKFSLVLEGFPGEEYLLSETVLGRTHGSSFDKWLEFGALPLGNRRDLEYLQSASLPLLRKKIVHAERGGMELAYTLEPHEVWLIEITSAV